MTVARESADDLYMDQALALARRGRGQTSPNPMVGAVIVSADGQVVGSGYHERAGDAHAEVRALGEAGPLARDGTLYCNLEPCAHQGRTGPCAIRIAEAGVARVVVGVQDPNPRVDGAGIALLRSRGVHVDIGVRRLASARLNEAFITWATRHRPFVTMKIATSLDGRIASRPETRTQVSGPGAAAAVHRTRAEVDAIAIGSTTLRVDDPRLTARGVSRSVPLTRVVLDRALRTPPTAAVFQTLEAGPVVIVSTAAAVTEQPAAAERLLAVGARVVTVAQGTIDEIMSCLADLDITSLLLEGGTTVHRAAWSAGVVDRVQRYIAPIVLGRDGVPWLDDDVSVSTLRDARVERHGDDILVEGYVHRVG